MLPLFLSLPRLMLYDMMVINKKIKGEMDMKLLITGGSGFLGRRAVGYFETLGWHVFAPVRNQLNVTEESSLREWFRQNAPEAVIHTAAVSDTGLCQRQPEWSEHINVDSCVNLARICREYGTKLVICSSDQVYSGSTVPGPHRESEVLCPGNVYGSQKLHAEQRCLDILPETVCLRLSWMYAQNDLPGQHSHFLAALKASLADENSVLTWPIHDRRGLTDVEVVIQNLPAALALSGGVWNFGSENDSNTYDTVKNVLEEMGMRSALRRLVPNEESFAENPRDIAMDLSRLNSAGILFPATGEGLKLALSAVVGTEKERLE